MDPLPLLRVPGDYGLLGLCLVFDELKDVYGSVFQSMVTCEAKVEAYRVIKLFVFDTMYGRSGSDSDPLVFALSGLHTICGMSGK